MIFWITLILLVVGLVWNHFNEDVNFIPFALPIVAGFASVIMLFIIIFSNVAVDAQIKKNEQRYDSLVYQYENNLYDNDNDLGKKELMNQIQDWNEDLAFYKEAQDDFWIGIFYPNIFDNFEFIELGGKKEAK